MGAGVYTLGLAARAGVNVANSPLYELKTAATDRARIREVVLTILVASTTAPNFVLARATNTSTATTPTVPLPEDPADAAGTGALATAWTTAPTFSTTGPWLRRWDPSNAVGAYTIWSWPPGDELMVPVSSGLVIANLAAAGATLGSTALSIRYAE